MQKSLTLLFGLLTCSFVYAADAKSPEIAPVSGKIEWVYGYDEARQISRDMDKPIFVVIRCER